MLKLAIKYKTNKHKNAKTRVHKNVLKYEILAYKSIVALIITHREKSCMSQIWDIIEKSHMAIIV